MTLVDSFDSILMLYSYAGLFENPSRWKIFEAKQSQIEAVQKEEDPTQEKEVKVGEKTDLEENPGRPATSAIQEQLETKTTAKMNVMSGLSIVLTLMSIVVAFAYVPQYSSSSWIMWS
jgi:high-affinity nickel-transport protein